MIATRYVTLASAHRLIIPSLALYAMCMVPAAFVHNGFVAGALFFIQGLPVLVFGICSTSIRQARIPKHLRGRASTVFYFAGAGLSPIGLAVGGVLAASVGPGSAFFIGGVGILATIPFLLVGVRSLAGEANADVNVAVSAAS